MAEAKAVLAAGWRASNRSSMQSWRHPYPVRTSPSCPPARRVSRRTGVSVAGARTCGATGGLHGYCYPVSARRAKRVARAWRTRTGPPPPAAARPQENERPRTAVGGRMRSTAEGPRALRRAPLSGVFSARSRHDPDRVPRPSRRLMAQHPPQTAPRFDRLCGGHTVAGVREPLGTGIASLSATPRTIAQRHASARRYIQHLRRNVRPRARPSRPRMRNARRGRPGTTSKRPR